MAALDLSKFSFEYYEHESDNPKVLTTLLELGLQPRKKRYEIASPTNGVLFSSDVPQELVRFIGIALIKAGVPIYGLEYYGVNPAKPRPFRVRLVQVGSVGVENFVPCPPKKSLPRSSR